MLLEGKQRYLIRFKYSIVTVFFMYFKTLKGINHKINVFLKENRFKVSVTLFSLIVFSVLFYFIYYEGLFEEKVEFFSYELGNKNTNYSFPSEYLMFVNFSSNGAFVAGRKIHVSIDFLLTSISPPEFRDSELKVVFPGGLPYPIPEGLERMNEAEVMLHFTDERSAHGEKDIVYLMPELPVRESPVLPFQTNGRYSYNLLIDGNPQILDKINRGNTFLYIAPLETELQLKNNNLILILTLFAVYLTILQIFISTKK